jgi:hypothetical protein
MSDFSVKLSPISFAPTTYDKLIHSILERSIVVNELVQVGIEKIIRTGTCSSIHPHIPVGSIV